MKNVISASRRTDIPAYYLPWLMERIKQGYVEVVNPFYRKQSRRISLRPDRVLWLVLWSRNYQRFIKEMDFFREYQLFFHFTILSPSKMEKAPLQPQQALRQAEQLAKMYGGERIIWRYDPLVFWREGNALHSNYNAREFARLCRELSALGISRCYTSVAHPYRKFIRRFTKKFPENTLPQATPEDEQTILREMSRVCARHGMRLYSCCTDRLLSIPGISPASCIDGRLLNSLFEKEKVSTARIATRPQCRCTRSIDIGDYLTQPCATGCIYCYANPLWE